MLFGFFNGGGCVAACVCFFCKHQILQTSKSASIKSSSGSRAAAHGCVAIHHCCRVASLCQQEWWNGWQSLCSALFVLYCWEPSSEGLCDHKLKKRRKKEQGQWGVSVLAPCSGREQWGRGRENLGRVHGPDKVHLVQPGSNQRARSVFSSHLYVEAVKSRDLS